MKKLLIISNINLKVSFDVQNLATIDHFAQGVSQFLYVKGVVLYCITYPDCNERYAISGTATVLSFSPGGLYCNKINVGSVSHLTTVMSSRCIMLYCPGRGAYCYDQEDGLGYPSYYAIIITISESLLPHMCTENKIYNFLLWKEGEVETISCYFPRLACTSCANFVWVKTSFV